VRIANDGVLEEDGSLSAGSTWPATGAVVWSLEDGPVVVPPRGRPIRTPGPSGPPLQPTGSAVPDGSAGPTSSGTPASPPPSLAPTPTPAPIQGVRTIFVQWRDVAGNWSVPTAVDAWYAPEGSVMPEPTPSPTPTPEPSPSPLALPSPSAAVPSVQPGASVGPLPSEMLESASAS
jgi:hypothetical protein